MNIAPAFPTQHLPADWAGWIDTTSARLGAPADYLAAGLFAALAAAAGDRIVVEPLPGRPEKLELWLCQVGGPWTGKSDALEAAAALALADDKPPWRQDALADWLAKPRNRTASVVAGALRPPELAGAFAGKDESLAARFLFFWPERPPWRSLTELARAGAAEGTVSLVGIAELVPDPAHERVLPFTAEALTAFDAFCAGVYEELGEGDGAFAAWLAHARTRVTQLALALTLLEAWADGALPQAIEAGTVERAIALHEEYFRPQALRVLARCAEGQRLAPVERVLRWLQQEGVESVSQEEVRRFGLNQSLSAAAAGRVIAELEARGMLVAMPQPEERGRGRPSPRWSVDRAAVGKSENRKIDDGPGDGPPDRRRGTVEFEMPEIETAADLRPALKALTRQTAEGKLTPGECHKMSSVVRTHASIIETVELEPRIAEIKKAIEQDRKLRKALQGIAEQSRAKAAPPPS